MKDDTKALNKLKASTYAEIAICQEQIDKMANLSKQFQEKINRYNRILGEIETSEKFAKLVEGRNVKK